MADQEDISAFLGISTSETAAPASAKELAAATVTKQEIGKISERNTMSRALKIGITLSVLAILGYFGFLSYDSSHFSERKALRAIKKVGLQYYSHSDNSVSGETRAISKAAYNEQGLFRGPIISVKGIRSHLDPENRTIVDADMDFVYNNPYQKNDRFTGSAVAFFEVYTNGHCVLKEVVLSTDPPIHFYVNIDPDK